MKLTIFTPTYNRESELYVLFESLQKQTNKNFCWLIVDDGSTDNTAQVVQKMETESNFMIEYIYQENQGKPFAFNKGVECANTEYFMSMDSDDTFIENAVEIFYDTVNKINKEKNYVGLVFQALDANMELLTKVNFPENPWYSDFYTMLFEKNIFGDTAIFYRTGILKQNLFPRFNEEKFVPEALLLHRLAKIANFYFFNIPLIIKDYKIDGFSNNMMDLYQKNPRGYFIYCLEVLNFHNTKLIQKLRHIAAVGVFGKKIGMKPKEIGNMLEKKSDRLLYYLILPAVYLYKL